MELEVAEERAERACIAEGRDRGQLELENDNSDEENEAGVRDGELTIHRLRLSCSCSHLSSYEQCSEPLPLAAQGYPARASHTYFFSRHLQQQKHLSR